MPQIVGQDPHPRALLLSVQKEHLASIAACFPVSVEISEADDVVMDEWDVVVCEGDAPGWIAEHLYVVSFGDGFWVPPADVSQFRLSGPRSLGRWVTSPARQLVIPENLPVPVSQLVRGALAPAAEAASRNNGGNTVLVVGNAPNHCVRSAIKAVRPFLHTLEESLPIAGSWMRKGGAEVWSLPAHANRPSWIKAALEVWSEKEPARFPRSKWKDRPEWATPDESRLRARRDEIVADRTAVVDRFDAQVREAAALIERATEEADTGLRALLLSQGDALVSAVEVVMRGLGFEVRNMDLETPEHDRREDLRVTLPGSDWTAIVEVRGYKGGAAVNDLMRIERFATRFAAETSRAPDARWYVVNQFLGRDPSERPLTLQSNPEELQSFAEGGGLVADTTELFRLARALDLDGLPPETARKVLIDCRGRFIAANATGSTSKD
jgi:hypothetical protein